MSLATLDEEIAYRVSKVQSRIKAAAERMGRNPGSILLLGVSKRFSSRHILAAAEAGVHAFGENYIQEAKRKMLELEREYRHSHGTGDCNEKTGVRVGPSGLRMDFIGHLQRNKVKKAVGFFELIHSVDGMELASSISETAVKRGIEQKILIQVNISEEESKSGIDPTLVVELAKNVDELPGVLLMGLMCIGSPEAESCSEGRSREEFAKMRNMRDELERSLACRLPELSMGMSDNFETAIEEGATILRLGRAIFGSRTDHSCSQL